MPQGSVLGPVLFVLFINDIPDIMTSHAYLFAGDTSVFRRVENEYDSKKLQADLNELQMWSERWLLRCHPDKCKWMTVNRVADGNQRKYHMTNYNSACTSKGKT